MSLLIAHEVVKPPTWKMSVAVKSRTILPSASRPFAWAVAVVQFSAVRANQKQPEELHVTSIIATAMVDIAGNNSPVPLVVRSMVGNQSQSAQNKHSGPIFPVCLSLVSIQSRCGLWRLGRMKTCLHIGAPLFPSIIDPTDPTELQRRRQAVSQAQPAMDTVSTQIGAGRAGSSWVTLLLHRSPPRRTGQYPVGMFPRLQTFTNSPKSCVCMFASKFPSSEFSV